MLRSPASLDAQTAAVLARYRSLVVTLAEAHATALRVLAADARPEQARECDAAIAEIEGQLREMRAAMQYDRHRLIHRRR